MITGIDPNSGATASKQDAVMPGGGFGRGLMSRLAPDSLGGVLFSLSALSILYGLSRIIGPILGPGGSFDPWRTVPCVGALNFYELALLGVLLAVAARWAAANEAVLLAGLTALFLGASGIANTTVANDSISAAILFGVLCAVLAVLKVSVLSDGVGVVFPRGATAGLGVLLGWNFLMSPALAIHRSPLTGRLLPYDAWAPDTLPFLWTGGWVIVLAGIVIVILPAFRLPTAAADASAKGMPLLRHPAMGWIWAGILLAGVCAHQYALAYVYDIRCGFYDYLPVLALAALAGLELLRAYMGRVKWATLVPMALLAIVFYLSPDLFWRNSGAAWQQHSSVIGWIWHPSFLAGVMAAAMLWRGIRTGWMEYWRVLPLWCTLAALCLPAGDVISWPRGESLALVTLVVSCIVVAVANRRPHYAFLAVVVFAFANGGLVRHGELPAVFCLVGIGTLLVYVLLRDLLGRWVVLAGFALMALGVSMMPDFTILRDHTGWIQTWRDVFAAMAGVTCLGVLVLTRDWLLGTLLTFAPLAWFLWTPTRHGVTLVLTPSGWHFIVLSFLLLGVGAYVTLHQKHPTETPETRPHAME